MKSLLLKDLYGLYPQVRTMLFVIVALAIGLIPASGTEAFQVACTVMCTMLLVTSFALDEASGWNRYAMTMPFNRKDIVAAKYVLLVILAAVGAVAGVAIVTLAGVFLRETHRTVAENLSLFQFALCALALGMMAGGTAIPLLLRFGAEKGRLLMIVAAVIPAALVLAAYGVMQYFGITENDGWISVVLWLMPIPAAGWNWLMYCVSCKIFEKKDL